LSSEYAKSFYLFSTRFLVLFLLQGGEQMISIPFSGSKRNRYKEVKQIVQDQGYKKVYEAFGGSAVLSVNLFREGIVERAVINDYDRLFDLYPDYLDIKDNLIKKCLEAGFIKSNKRLNDTQREYLQSMIATIDEKYWRLLANNFVFSEKQTGTLKPSDFTYFHNDITTEKQREYLQTVQQMERVSMDYKEFLTEHYKDFDDTTIIILDPPYMNSTQKAYDNRYFFGLSATLKMLQMVKEMQVDFIFFNMIERDVIEVLKVFGFQDFKVSTRRITQTSTSSREDCLAYVRNQFS